MVDETFVRKQHFRVVELPGFRGLRELLEHPVGNRDFADTLRNDLEYGGLQHHVRVVLVNTRRHFPALGEKFRVGNPRLAAPKVDRSAGEFCAGILQHADVVIQVTGRSVNLRHRNRSGKVILQHLPRNLTVEAVTALAEQSVNITGDQQQAQA